MNELMKQKRDNFRIQIRNKVLNEKFSQVRISNLQKNGQGEPNQVLYYAKQHEFNFQDIQSLNQYLKMILDTWYSHNDDILYKCLEIIGAQYTMDSPIQWFEQQMLETILDILKSKNSNSNILNSIFKLLVNTSFHFDWVILYLLEQDIMSVIIQLINSNLSKDILKNVLNLIGNLVVNNLDLQKQILCPQLFNQITNQVNNIELMEVFLSIIRNFQHASIQNEELKTIIHFWINNRPDCERIRDKFYEILSSVTYQSTQAIEIFPILYQNGLILDAINDIKHFKKADNLEYCLALLSNLCTLDYDFIMIMVNNGILEAVIVHLSQDLFLYDTLYLIMSNVTFYEELFLQACLYGFLGHLQRHIIYNTENPNLTILREILFCLGSNIDQHCLRFVNDFLNYQIDNALINFIISELACYAREELLYAIKILYKLWNIQINKNALDKQLWSKLIQIQLEEFSHMETNELINLIDNYKC